MLISFRTANFLSFNDEVEFSMLAGQPRQLPSHVIHSGEGRSQIDILKSAVIYGANASGKSNLIKAMDFARKIIVNGLKSETTFNKHFRLDPTNIDKPSKFEFEFKLGEKIYAYGFTLHLASQKFKSEWLVEVGKTTDKPIFEREILENGQSKFKLYLKLTKKNKTRFQVYQEDVLDNQLFLTELSDKNIQLDEEISIFLLFNIWIKKYLVFIYPQAKFHGLDFIGAAGDFQSFFQAFLYKFNTGITNLSTSDITEDEARKIIPINMLEKAISNIEVNKLITITNPNNYKQLSITKDIFGKIKYGKLVTSHEDSIGNKIEFELDDESDGTRRILDLIPLFEAVKKNYTIFIDEIDRSLHPELTRKLLEIFHANTEGVESQLIVTTHESSLLDLNLLRRDEIWFAEKNEKGESKFYSLEEFKPRHDVELRKAYLLGRFGAIPFISNTETLGWTKKTFDKQLQTAPSV